MIQPVHCMWVSIKAAYRLHLILLLPSVQPVSSGIRCQKTQAVNLSPLS